MVKRALGKSRTQISLCLTLKSEIRLWEEGVGESLGRASN